MTGSATPADSQPVLYLDSAYDPSWDPAFEEQWEPDRVVLRGACPRCQDPMAFPIGIGEFVLDTGTKSFRPDNLPSEWRTVFCRCTQAHEGQPEAANDGCGATWYLLVPKP
jgi:hypothetical protein